MDICKLNAEKSTRSKNKRHREIWISMRLQIRRRGMENAVAAKDKTLFQKEGAYQHC